MLKSSTPQQYETTTYLMSGGLSSTLAAYYHLIVTRSNTKPIYYFNDTLIEDPDLYRFLVESVYFLTGKILLPEVLRMVHSIPDLAPGITTVDRKSVLDILFERVSKDTGLIRDASVDPWEAFESAKYIGNTRVDVCSRVLKREPRYVFTSTLPNNQICLGFGWAEMDRFETALTHELNLIAPLATNFVESSVLYQQFFYESGIRKSRSYDSGFPHDNCGGFCVKAGLNQFDLLWRNRPNVYLWHEQRMEEVISRNPKLKPFLRKMISGSTRYLTLREYRIEYLEKNLVSYDKPIGGCGCAML